MRRSGSQVIGLWLIGVLLAQAAWIISVPPFRGSDEVDHVYRAAGVAEGQWRLTEVMPGGRGEAVSVPADIVEAAMGLCGLDYMTDASCKGFTTDDEGLVDVSTAAGSYNPLYYALVGWTTRFFDGTAGLYVMRGASALIASLFLVAAWAALRLRYANRLMAVATVAALTPTLLYSTTIVAPNGLEMSVGLALWAALLGLDPADSRPSAVNRWLLVLAGVSGVLLVSLRTLGPLWAVLIVACVVIAQGRQQIVLLLRRHRVSLTAVAGAVGAALVASLLWSRSAGLLGANGPSATGPSAEAADTSWTTAIDFPRWVFQTVGAFPLRTHGAPVIVYPLVLAVVVVVLVIGFRTAAQRGRLALAVASIASLAVPAALVALTLEAQGSGWQGRYSLPFVVGILPLAASVTRDGEWRARFSPSLLALAAFLMIGVAHVVSVTDVRVQESVRLAGHGNDFWAPPPVWVTVAVATSAWVVLAASLSRNREKAPLP